MKIDTLLSGENESNKILDDLGPAMDRIDKTYDLLKDIDESDEKFRKFFTDRVRFNLINLEYKIYLLKS